MDKVFALQQIFGKSWEHAKKVNACFADLDTAYDRIPRDKLWAVLLQYDINTARRRNLLKFVWDYG